MKNLIKHTFWRFACDMASLIGLAYLIAQGLLGLLS